MAIVAPSRLRTGRGAELGLLALAIAVGLAALAIVGLNTAGTIPAKFLTYAAVLIGVGLGMHLLIRWRAPYADPVILPIVLGLNGLGLAMIYRIDVARSTAEKAVDASGRQLLWTLVGAAAAAVVLVLIRDHRSLRKVSYLSMVGAVVLLLLPMVPGLGSSVYGANLWISVGGMSFQPAEVAKILMAIFFAGYLVDRRDSLTLAGPKVLGLQFPRLIDIAPLLAVWAVCVGILVMQRDLGTSMLVFGLFVAMLYVATERVSWILIGMVLLGIGLAVAVMNLGYVQARFDVWLHALDNDVYNRHPGGSGQVVAGMFGLAAGGLMGTGLGEGHPALVPFADSDFIVASLGEELGLTGLLAVLMMYAILAQRGIRAAIGVRDGFGKLLAAGFAFTIAWQVFIVVGGITRVIPLTGLTTPFLAAGGSSLVANWMIAALLLRISDAARRPAPATGPLGHETVAIALTRLGTDEDAPEHTLPESYQPDESSPPDDAVPWAPQEQEDWETPHERAVGDNGEDDNPTQVVNRP